LRWNDVETSSEIYMLDRRTATIMQRIFNLNPTGARPSICANSSTAEKMRGI
jgi:hypothetical protein